MRGYGNELACYQRLSEFGCEKKIGQFWVPQLVDYNHKSMVIEMSVVQKPPYIIDFAKSMIDRDPEFSDDILRHHDAKGWEEFGDNWPQVRVLMKDLESFGIYYLDPRPHNIVFNMP